MLSQIWMEFVPKKKRYDEYEMTINEVSWKALTCKSMQMKSQHDNIKIPSASSPPSLIRLFRVYSHFVFYHHHRLFCLQRNSNKKKKSCGWKEMMWSEVSGIAWRDANVKNENRKVEWGRMKRKSLFVNFVNRWNFPSY